MKPRFEVQPKVGVGPVKLGVERSVAIQSMGAEPDSFKKTPMSQHPTDAFFESGFQIFYEGDEPRVESIELSRECGFEATISGVNVLDLPVSEALSKIEEIVGITPVTEDGGYSFEIPQLGLWLWRPSNDLDDEEGRFFSTIGVGVVPT